MIPDTQKPPVLVLVRDLMFSSRIRAIAAATGAEVMILREPERLADAAGRRLIVDLNQPGAMESAAEWSRRTGGAVIGFVSHTDAATIAAARAAGFAQVLPRSRFVEILPELISRD